MLDFVISNERIPVVGRPASLHSPEFACPGLPGILYWVLPLLNMRNSPQNALVSSEVLENEFTPWMTFWDEAKGLPVWQQSKQQHYAISHAVSYSEQQSRKVSFGSVTMRVYSITIGDNPSCISGVPTSLDWEYKQLPSMSLEYFDRRSKRLPSVDGRSRRGIRVLSATNREALLRSFGYTQNEIQDAIKEKIRVQRERRTTDLLLPVSKIEEAVTSGRRKFRRVLMRNVSS